MKIEFTQIEADCLRIFAENMTAPLFRITAILRGPLPEGRVQTSRSYPTACRNNSVSDEAF
jgi:hypothetical protein